MISKDQKNQIAHINGYDNKAQEIAEMGWAAARDKFNLENQPVTHFGTLEAYHYAKGELQALCDTEEKNR